MDPLDATLIDGLLDPPSTPCVSIFLSGYRSSTTGNPGRIQLKNLIGAAEAKLVERGMRRTAAAELLEPAQELLDDNDFWQHRQNGLAVFLSPGFAQWLWLPIEPQESLTVADRFKLRPLLPALWPDQRFYVLAISPDGHRLFRGSRWQFEEVALQGVPGTMKEMLRTQGIETDVTIRTGGGRPRQHGGVAYHGHGIERGLSEEGELEYFRQIDRAVVTAVQRDPGPLVIAAAQEQIAAYRDITGCQDVLDRGIEGNPDGVKADELHEKAWPLVKFRACEIQQQAFERYRQQAGHDRAAIGLGVLEAAYQGKVDTLFLAEQDGSCFGRFDAMSGEVEVHDPPQPQDEDLLDLAASFTISRGGRVFVLPRERMPEGRALAALLRF